MPESITTDIPQEEIVRLVNLGGYTVVRVVNRLGAEHLVGQTVTNLTIGPRPIFAGLALSPDATIITEAGSCVLDSFMRADFDGSMNRKTAFTNSLVLFAEGPGGGPSPAITLRPPDTEAFRVEAAKSQQRLQEAILDAQKLRELEEETVLIRSLRALLVGHAPVDVELFREGDDEGIKLVYADGRRVSILLKYIDIETSWLVIGGQKVAR